MAPCMQNSVDHVLFLVVNFLVYSYIPTFLYIRIFQLSYVFVYSNFLIYSYIPTILCIRIFQLSYIFVYSNFLSNVPWLHVGGGDWRTYHFMSWMGNQWEGKSRMFYRDTSHIKLTGIHEHHPHTSPHTNMSYWTQGK